MSKASLETEIRNDVLSRITEMLSQQFDTDVLPVSASELALPVVDAENNEKFALIKVSIPRGTRTNGGYEPYDGYAMAEQYKADLQVKEDEKKAKEEKKAQEEKRKAEARELRKARKNLEKAVKSVG